MEIFVLPDNRNNGNIAVENSMRIQNQSNNFIFTIIYSFNILNDRMKRHFKGLLFDLEPCIFSCCFCFRLPDCLNTFFSEYGRDLFFLNTPDITKPVGSHSCCVKCTLWKSSTFCCITQLSVPTHFFLSLSLRIKIIWIFWTSECRCLDWFVDIL